MSWSGEERRVYSEAVVERAAEAAAQRVAAIHRRRLVRWSFIAALIAALVVSVPLVLVTNHQRAATARANAVFVCENSKEYLAVFQAFLKSDAHLRQSQQHYAERAKVLKAFSKLLEPKLLRKLEARSDTIELHATRFWTTRLIPRLARLSALNCQASLR